MAEETRWRGWNNAEIYDRFVRERQIYRWLNERLIERASLENAQRVLDLGCGTGATAQACLAVLPADAEVVGLDASPEMVAVATAQTLDPRARFVVADAAAAAEVLQGPFDRAVSNAAFWQFPNLPQVLRGLSGLLSRGARFVFNVPAERDEAESAPFHPFQVALARAIGERIGEPYIRSSTPFDPQALRELADATGFELIAEERLEYQGKQGEMVELMEIPAMIQPLTRGIGEQERGALVAEAAAATDPQERVRIAWLYFTLERR